MEIIKKEFSEKMYHEVRACIALYKKLLEQNKLTGNIDLDLIEEELNKYTVYEVE